MVEITCDQAAQVREKIAPALGYLTKLRRRMEQLRMQDKLYNDVVRAQQSMQDLCVELHYLSCSTGVARKPR